MDLALQNNTSDKKQKLIGLSLDELTAIVAEMGEKPFRTKQIWQWMYNKGASEFDAMSNLSANLRHTLNERFTLARPEIVKDLTSFDGTRKWLLRFDDGQEVETVYIPEDDRGTLCISSQVGCTLTCKFCHTGTQKLVRNLEAHEIVQQVLLAKDMLEDWPSTREFRKVTNIVLMGMGEPLYNYDNVATAMKIVMNDEGIALSKRRITLSTSGVVPEIRRCGEELGVNLAISLHAVNDTLRDEIVPLNKKYPIAELLQACRDYPAANNTRRITFEYVMLKDVNDTVADAHALVKLIKGIPAKVNLIPFNAWPGAPYERSTTAAISAFAAIVNDAGYASPVRTPRGQDILAACGQLKSDSVRLSKSRRVDVAAA